MPKPNQTPEQAARDTIDKILVLAGWIVQDKKKIDFGAGPGVAVREYQTDIGPADYVLFVDNLHTILRLPTAILYAHGVKANVMFFDNHEASPNPWTKEVWFYDYRTNIDHTLKKKPLRFEDLEDFAGCYKPENRRKRKPTWDADNASGLPDSFTRAPLVARDKASLDVFWLENKGRIGQFSGRG